MADPSRCPGVLMAPDRYTAVVVSILTLGASHRAEAQAQRGTHWSVGVDAVLTSGPTAPTAFLELSAARTLVSHHWRGFRIEAGVGGAVSYERQLCSEFGECETRTVARIVSGLGTLTVGPAAARPEQWFYGLLSTGAYASWWHGGKYTPSQGVVPAQTASGTGPSGLALSGGLGSRLPLFDSSLRAEARV